MAQHLLRDDDLAGVRFTMTIGAQHSALDELTFECTNRVAVSDVAILLVQMMKVEAANISLVAFRCAAAVHLFDAEDATTELRTKSCLIFARSCSVGFWIALIESVRLLASTRAAVRTQSALRIAVLPKFLHFLFLAARRTTFLAAFDATLVSLRGVDPADVTLNEPHRLAFDMTCRPT